jgi:hypothetical protein
MQPVDNISNHGQGSLSTRPPGNTKHAPHWVVILGSCLCVVCIFIVGVYCVWATRRTSKGSKESKELKAKTRDVEEGSVSSTDGDGETEAGTDLTTVVLPGYGVGAGTGNAVEMKGENMKG